MPTALRDVHPDSDRTADIVRCLKGVESRCGAVALGRTSPLPPVCTDNLNAGVAVMKSAQEDVGERPLYFRFIVERRR